MEHSLPVLLVDVVQGSPARSLPAKQLWRRSSRRGHALLRLVAWM